jgi:hypothetical protein
VLDLLGFSETKPTQSCRTKRETCSATRGKSVEFVHRSFAGAGRCLPSPSHSAVGLGFSLPLVSTNIDKGNKGHTVLHANAAPGCYPKRRPALTNSANTRPSSFQRGRPFTLSPRRNRTRGLTKGGADGPQAQEKRGVVPHVWVGGVRKRTICLGNPDFCRLPDLT